MVENGCRRVFWDGNPERADRNHAVNIRDYTQDKHNKVDDYPYGGGAGTC